MKKENKEGLNGKAGFTTGLGALWVRKENLPTIRPQYSQTPKINPSLSLNYRKNKFNVFLQVDNLYTQTLNKNEFVTRTYRDGTIIKQQLKRNRNTNFFTAKAGVDYFLDERNTFTISGLFRQETIIDRGDQPFFKGDLSERLRLWQFLEDEVLTATMLSASYGHKFKRPGHVLNMGFNYTFDREDEKYFFDNSLPTYSSKEAFALIADQHVADVTLDYSKPFKNGRLETGFKFRKRDIPTSMVFTPGVNSPLDTSADGQATYKELIPALYGNYVFENKIFEAELGLRLEYVSLQYEVDPAHSTYQSDGYNYLQPFPTVRLAYKLNESNKLSFFYNRRVDRPNEVDIRIFPKYDDAEIIKVGNPALRPQFTTSLELGYKTSWPRGYLYGAAYHRFSEGTITRISSLVSGSTLIYAIFQNAGKSYNTGLELVLNGEVAEWYSVNLNVNGYGNRINAFSVNNLYPVANRFWAEKQEMFSGNIKLNNIFHLPGKVDAQLTAVYLAPDIIPQGKIAARSSLDLGVKKTLQQGRGELLLNATDLLNTMIIKREIQGEGFDYNSSDYYETQVIRAGYSYKF
jgi:outer membrane receptor protein involved in Fe transport